ncbi:glycosyltransferase [Prescottella defluvii]|uniref:glycosyltransferase n=1 Tax=Prescottella defluvii TaxID=1323361 RepID=UPI0004F2B4D2|nr:glycosyltransferase [Prescottella defluvii]
MNDTSVFISWIKFHGRSAELAARLGSEPVFMESRWPKAPAPLRYLELAVRTARLLRKGHWSAVIVMLPPAPLLLVAKLFKKRGTPLVADMHTGVFSDPKWKWALGPSMKIIGRDFAIVTNSELVDVCADHGVRAFALHDVVSSKTEESGDAAESDRTVLCPLAYASDEPIAEMMEAAQSLPDITFLLTGNAPEHVRSGAPSNVVFTGYLSNADYDDTMRRAGVVLALTTRDHTMQRAGYEALMWGVPVVTSDFALLRDYFGEAALYSDCSAADIRDKVARAFAENAELRAKSAEVLELQILEQDRQIGNVRGILTGPVGAR